MKVVKLFIDYLCSIDLSHNARNVLYDLYDKIETLDVDLEEKAILKNESLPLEEKQRIVDLIEFYYAHADDCINKYTDKEIYSFLQKLKSKAEEINLKLKYPYNMFIEQLKEGNVQQLSYKDCEYILFIVGNAPTEKPVFKKQGISYRVSVTIEHFGLIENVLYYTTIEDFIEHFKFDDKKFEELWSELSLA